MSRSITLDYVSKNALSKLRKESRPRATGLQCFTSQGAGTQHLMHFNCAPARSHTTTTSNTTKITPHPLLPPSISHREAPQTASGRLVRRSLMSNAHLSQTPPSTPPPTPISDALCGASATAGWASDCRSVTLAYA